MSDAYGKKTIDIRNILDGVKGKRFVKYTGERITKVYWN